MLKAIRRYLFDLEVVGLMGLTILVKPIGLVTQVLLAKYYGASAEYDAYALTFFLVTFLDTSIGQTFITVAVPYIIRLKTRLSPREVFQFQNTVMLLFLVPVAIYLLILFFRSDLVLAVVGPGLPETTGSFVNRMARWMAIPGVFVVAITMGRGILNLNGRYRVAAALPPVNGLVMLLAIIVLQGPLGIWALPAGFVISVVIRFLVTAAYGLATRSFSLVQPGAQRNRLSEFWSLVWVILVAQTLLTINYSVDKFFATGLAEGSISSITYAMSIVNLGTQLFNLSLMTIMFTRMSEYLAAGDMATCNGYILDNLKRMTRILVPASLAASLAGPEIVQVIYQRGAFDAADAARTSGALVIYLLGLPGMVLVTLVARISHALQKFRDRMWLCGQILLTNGIGNFLLVKHYQINGLAISSVLAFNLHLALSFWVLYRYRSGLRIGEMVRVVTHAYVLGLAVYLVYRLAGLEAVLDTWALASPFWGALAVIAGKFVIVLVLFTAGYLAWRRWESHRHHKGNGS